MAGEGSAVHIYGGSAAVFPWGKRAFDLLFSLLLGVAFAPLFLIVAALVRLIDGGPVIYWQKRVGENGREFWFPKFRSMRVGAEDMQEELWEQNHHGEGVTFKMMRDPRVTRLGRVLRRLSLDELPQLWSVLRGDMSLVGPRPPVPAEVALYTPWERRRLEVKPGLTCLWQISGRSELPFSRQVELDVQYIDRQSLWLDLKILLLTVPAVLSRRGAW
jgi:lipopolysaccharide/colanic/teichoic acid biosynthesis glycosyltransferase